MYKYNHHTSLKGFVIFVTIIVLFCLLSKMFKKIDKSRKNKLLISYGKDPEKWADFANARTYEQLSAWLKIEKAAETIKSKKLNTNKKGVNCMIGKWKVKITDINETSDGKIVVGYKHDFPVYDLEENEGVYIADAETGKKLEIGKEYYLGFEDIQASDK